MTVGGMLAEDFILEYLSVPFASERILLSDAMRRPNVFALKSEDERAS